MKPFINSILFLFVLLIITWPLNGFSSVGDVITAEFKVEGICGMCKERIENGALIKGVKKVEWEKETEMLTVIYNSDKVELLDIHKAVAEVGHSTDKVKAKESVYDRLPDCCKYKEVEKH